MHVHINNIFDAIVYVYIYIHCHLYIIYIHIHVDDLYNM